MNFIETGLIDVICFEPVVFGDARGFFLETWRDSWREKIGMGNLQFVQDNHSLSRKGVLRGLHYQIRQPQGKLVRIVRGEVFDVAVDMRRQSSSFGRWAGARLSADNKRIMWVPPGFAHGFLVLSEEAELLYKCTDYYAPEHDRTVKWNDSDIAISWPLDSISEVVLSEKDLNGASLKQADAFEEDLK